MIATGNNNNEPHEWVGPCLFNRNLLQSNCNTYVNRTHRKQSLMYITDE